MEQFANDCLHISLAYFLYTLLHSFAFNEFKSLIKKFAVSLSINLKKNHLFFFGYTDHIISYSNNPPIIIRIMHYFMATHTFIDITF
jgi:hypothetical protein